MLSSTLHLRCGVVDDLGSRLVCAWALGVSPPLNYGAGTDGASRESVLRLLRVNRLVCGCPFGTFTVVNHKHHIKGSHFEERRYQRRLMDQSAHDSFVKFRRSSAWSKGKPLAHRLCWNGLVWVPSRHPQRLRSTTLPDFGVCKLLRFTCA